MMFLALCKNEKGDTPFRLLLDNSWARRNQMRLFRCVTGLWPFFDRFMSNFMSLFIFGPQWWHVQTFDYYLSDTLCKNFAIWCLTQQKKSFNLISRWNTNLNLPLLTGTKRTWSSEPIKASLYHLLTCTRFWLRKLNKQISALCIKKSTHSNYFRPYSTIIATKKINQKSNEENVN